MEKSISKPLTEGKMRGSKEYDMSTAPLYPPPCPTPNDSNAKNREVVVNITSYMDQFLNTTYVTLSQDERDLIERIGCCLGILLENLEDENTADKKSIEDSFNQFHRFIDNITDENGFGVSGKD